MPMPNTPPETGDADTAKFLPRDSFKPPEHISMDDMAYVAHLINNAITVIKISINYQNDLDVQEELKQAKEIMIGRINFLLTRYQEDLKNMPEVKNFLELLRYLIEQDQLQHAVNLQQLADRAFQMGALDKPGRHLSQEMSAVTESQEAVSELKLTVFDRCKNTEGLYVGLSAVQRTKLDVEVGGTVEIIDEKGQSFGVFTVGKGSSEIADHTDLFTVNGVEESTTVTVRKAISTPDKPKEFKLPITHAVETTIERVKHKARIEKIAVRFPNLDSEMYITLPTAVAAQLGIKPEPGKTVAPISKCLVRDASGRQIEMAIVPAGTTIGFTSDAAKELDIPAGLAEIKIIIDKGVLVIG